MRRRYDSHMTGMRVVVWLTALAGLCLVACTEQRDPLLENWKVIRAPNGDVLEVDDGSIQRTEAGRLSVAVRMMAKTSYQAMTLQVDCQARRYAVGKIGPAALPESALEFHQPARDTGGDALLNKVCG